MAPPGNNWQGIALKISEASHDKYTPPLSMSEEMNEIEEEKQGTAASISICININNSHHNNSGDHGYFFEDRESDDDDHDDHDDRVCRTLLA